VYAIAAASAVLVALDTAGIAFSFASLLVIPCLFATTLVTLIRTPSFLRKHGRRGLLPVATSVLALPVGIAASATYARLHFPLHRAHYEKVALAVKAGTYVLPLKPEDASLGRANLVRDGGNVVAVSFMTVSHGFAGHGGYLRAFGDETALKQDHPPGGWTFARPLGERWYAVGEH
jgi:hypothetical protein